MRELDNIRKDLESCDLEVFNMLKKRFGYMEELIAYKKQKKIPVFEPEQEKLQLEHILEAAGNDGYEEQFTGVFKKIIEESKRVQSKCLFDYNIALIGFMGAGKSTVSRYLKKMLAMKEVDVDKMIVREQKMPIKDIFSNYGEEHFRKLESDAIIRLQSRHQTIISCGGGAVMREENVANLKKGSRIVLLTASPQSVLERVKDSDERPILNGNMNVEFINQLMEKRAANYQKAADVIIKTDHKDIRKVCEELIRFLIQFDKNQQLSE